MPLTPEQIALANTRGNASASQDGRIQEGQSGVASKPTPQPSKPIESIAELPPATDDTTVDTSNTPANEPQQTDDSTPAIVEDDSSKTINFNDFLKASAVDTTPLEDKTPELKKDDAPLIKASPDATTTLKTTDDQSAQQQQQAQPKLSVKEQKAKDLASRDVSDLPQDIAPFFKDNMSRPAFDKIKPIVLEHKVLKEQNVELSKKVEQLSKGAPPDSYYEHPSAYVLTPEFAQQSNNVNVAQALVSHWEKQFSDLKDGAAEYENIDFDQNGNLVRTKVKADKGAEMNVMRALNFTQNQLIQQQASLQALGAVHQEKHKAAIAWAKQHEATVFSILDKAENKNLLQGVANIMKSFHPSFHSNPLAPHLAKAEMLMMTMGNYIQQLEQQLQGKSGKGKPTTTTNGNGKPTNAQPSRAQTLAERQRLAGPTSASTGHEGTEGEGNEGKEVTVDMFNRIKEGY